MPSRKCSLLQEQSHLTSAGLIAKRAVESHDGPKISGKKSRRPCEPMFARLTQDASVNIPYETTLGLSRVLYLLREDDRAKSARIAELEAELAAKHQEVDELLAAKEELLDHISVTSRCFRIEEFADNDQRIQRYVLAPSWAAFTALCDEIKQHCAPQVGTGALNLYNMVAMSVMRLRFDLSYELLAGMFFGQGGQITNVERIVHDTWARIETHLFTKEVYLLSEAEIARSYTPRNFAKALPHAVLCIDATYAYLDRPWAAGQNFSETLH